MSSVLKVMLFHLFLFLIKDSTQQTDPPIVEVQEGALEQNIVESEEEIKYSSAIRVAKSLADKLSDKLDPNFREMIICLLKKFIYEKMLSIKSERYMDEFINKYYNILEVLIEFISKNYQETNPDPVAHICKLCDKKKKNIWIALTAYGSCMKPETPDSCTLYSLDAKRWRDILESLVSHLNNIILKEVGTEIKEFLLPIFEIDDTHAGSIKDDYLAMKLLISDLRDPKNYFKEIYPDIRQRTYLVLSALSMLPILSSFSSINTNKFMKDFERKMDGHVACLLLIRDCIYKNIPEELMDQYNRLKRLLSKFLDEKIRYLATKRLLPEEYARKWLESPDRMPPPPPVLTIG